MNKETIEVNNKFTARQELVRLAHKLASLDGNGNWCAYKTKDRKKTKYNNQNKKP